MKTASLGMILAFLLAYQGPAVVRRGALNRDLIGCLKATRGSDAACPTQVGTGDYRGNYFVGLAELKTGHPKEAIPFLREYARSNTRDDLASYYLGLAYRSDGNEAAAIQVWRTGGLARQFAAIGWREGSTDALRTAIAIGDRESATFYKLGDLLWDAGRDQEGVAAYRQGVAFDRRESPPRLLAAARIAEGEGNWSKAVRINEEFIAQQPGDSRGYLHTAEILRRQHLTEQAIASYEQCAARTGAVSCYLGAAETCLAGRDIAGALHWGNEARRLFPGKSEPLILLGATLLAAGRVKDASQAYAGAASIDPRNFWIPLYQGDVASRNGDLDGALRYYGQALRLNPNSPVVFLSLGIAYQHRGELAAASASYKKALALAPGQPAAEKGLQEIEAQAERGLVTSNSSKHVR